MCSSEPVTGRHGQVGSNYSDDERRGERMRLQSHFKAGECTGARRECKDGGRKEGKGKDTWLESKKEDRKILRNK